VSPVYLRKGNKLDFYDLYWRFYDLDHERNADIKMFQILSVKLKTIKKNWLQNIHKMKKMEHQRRVWNTKQKDEDILDARRGDGKTMCMVFCTVHDDICDISIYGHGKGHEAHFESLMFTCQKALIYFHGHHTVLEDYDCIHSTKHGTHPPGIPEQDCSMMWVQTNVRCTVMCCCRP
jgi:hypothetical protein